MPVQELPAPRIFSNHSSTTANVDSEWDNAGLGIKANVEELARTAANVNYHVLKVIFYF